MGLREAIYHRRSIQDYEDHGPSGERIAQLIADAVQAPNSINRQAWAFTVVSGRTRLAEISRMRGRTMLSALCRVAARRRRR